MTTRQYTVFDSGDEGLRRFTAYTSGWAVEGYGPTREDAIAMLDARIEASRAVAVKRTGGTKKTEEKKTDRAADLAAAANVLARSTIPGLAAAGVLGGAYKGADIGERETLHHAVSDRDVVIGRLKRRSGDAFCNPRLNLADSMVWEDKSRIDCPRCLEIVKRAQGKAIAS